jgi:hypothetical protein
MGHDVDLILRHAPEGIVAAICKPDRLATIAITSQIGSHNSEVLSQAGRNAVPAHLGEWIAVQ